MTLLNLRGERHELGQNDCQRPRAFVFLSTECPVSNGSLATLNRLRSKFAASKVDLWGVVSDPTVTRAAAARHFAEFQVSFPVLFDSSGLLLDAFRPTHVPEAFVLDRRGQLLYRGAIDNAWESLGRRRTSAEREFLADAISAALGDQAPKVRASTPVGCLIEAPPARRGSGNGHLRSRRRSARAGSLLELSSSGASGAV